MRTPCDPPAAPPQRPARTRRRRGARRTPPRGRAYLGAALVAALLVTLLPAPALAAQPTVGGAGTFRYTREGVPRTIGSGLTVTGGGTYDGAHLDFAVTGATPDESLSLVTDGAPVTTAGVVSVVGSTVYLGNGTTADAVGAIDATLDGASGTGLRVNFSSEFANSGFETGDLTGWTALDQRIDLGVDAIAGCQTVDNSTYPGPVPNQDDNAPTTLGTLTSQVVTSDSPPQGTHALELQSSGMTTALGFDVVHGPAVFGSEFEARQNDTISFDWRASSGDDDFHVFGYIVDQACNQTTVLDATGGATTPWTTTPTTIPADGTYRFVFVAGTFDASGGRAAGARLLIDNVRVFGDSATDDVAQQVARKLQYTNVASSGMDGLRAVEVTATSSSGDSAGATITVDLSRRSGGSLPPEEVSGTLPPGGTLTTDPTGTGPTAQQPVTATIRTPVGGAVDLGVDAPAEADDRHGLTAFGRVVTVQAPASQAARPLELSLRVGASVLPGTGEGRALLTLEGAPVTQRCSGDGVADPDPCISSREVVDGELQLEVLTSQGGRFAFVEPTLACPESLTDSERFPDVPSAHAGAADCIAWWRPGAGFPDGTFGAERRMTRGQLASIVASSLGAGSVALPASPEARFSDVEGSVHADAILQLAALNLLNGFEDGSFGPNRVLTRAQVAAILVRIAEHLEAGQLPAAPEGTFPDIAGSVHRDDILKASAVGFTVGRDDGGFHPTADVTRGQGASFVVRMLDRLVRLRHADLPL